MNRISQKVLLAVAVVMAAATSVSSASVAGIDVTVKKDGKAVSRARTDASGKFATGAIDPGAYNVEFRAANGAALAKQQFAISITAGKQPPRQANAAGKHLGGGVAVNVEVAKPSRLTGTVTPAGAAVAEKKAVPAGYEEVKANVKVINGKRHVWVPAPIGSNMGGKWVEEGTEGAALRTNRRSGDEQMLRSIQDQSSNVGRRGE
jgi:hypothetical protein